MRVRSLLVSGVRSTSGGTEEPHMRIWTVHTGLTSGPWLGVRLVAGEGALEIVLLFSGGSESSQLLTDPAQEEHRKLFRSLGGRPTNYTYRRRRSQG